MDDQIKVKLENFRLAIHRSATFISPRVRPRLQSRIGQLEEQSTAWSLYESSLINLKLLLAKISKIEVTFTLEVRNCVKNIDTGPYPLSFDYFSVSVDVAGDQTLS